jgi:AAA+ ATPase superfamily predicted ATPase
MSENIAGRGREKQILSDLLISNRSELLAVYGRRRIGKTYLIREFFAKNTIFSFTGLSSGTTKNQIKNFFIKLNEFSGDFNNQKQPKDWLEAFVLLKKYLRTKKEGKKKKVIFIDEFPWIDSHKSGFLAAFENFWNDYCTTRKDLVVVVCGSAASYMIKKIINNSKGLSKRITQIIKLKPFNLKETKEFFKHKRVRLEEYEILKIYMALGGVAEYLEHIDPSDSAVTAIERLCFAPSAYLENEYNEVFKSLFKESSYHQKIVDTLAESPKRGITRNDIIKKLSISSGGRFSSALDELIQSGFVLKYEAYKNNTKSTLYRIYDEYCLFYLQFIKNNKGSSWIHLFQKQAYNTWCGFTFETICLKHVEAIKRALNCQQIESKNYTWYNDSSQIDLVIDRADGVVNLIEIKFYNDKFSIDADYLAQLRKKESQYLTKTKSKKSVFTVMLSTWGVLSNEYSKAIISKSLTITSFFS